MAELRLLRHEIALVNDEDFPKVCAYRWRLNSKGYVVTSTGSWRDGSYRLIYLHRLVMAAPDGIWVDHRNENSKLDNRKSNLRLATPSQNAAHRPAPRRAKTSKFKGVFWYEAKGKWQATIGVNEKKNGKRYIGRFDSEIEAAKAYNTAAKQHFGQFAELNVI